MNFAWKQIWTPQCKRVPSEPSEARRARNPPLHRHDYEHEHVHELHNAKGRRASPAKRGERGTHPYIDMSTNMNTSMNTNIYTDMSTNSYTKIWAKPPLLGSWSEIIYFSGRKPWQSEQNAFLDGFFVKNCFFERAVGGCWKNRREGAEWRFVPLFYPNKNGRKRKHIFSMQ